MAYNDELIAKKLRRWERYLNNYNLPKWEDIPDFGLYMEQVIALLGQYLDYIPAALKDEQFITAPTINNYVRKNVMPEPRKKMYYREHIAYLIIIVTLKQSLSLALIQKIIPINISVEEVEIIYNKYAERHRIAASYFINQINNLSATLLESDTNTKLTDSHIKNTEELIMASAVTSCFSRLLAEKLLLLDDKTLNDFADEQ